MVHVHPYIVAFVEGVASLARSSDEIGQREQIFYDFNDF